MFRLSQNPSKLVVLIGTICMMLYTLNPPRCSIDWNQGGVTREESAPLFSKMFHFVERPMPQNGSGRNFRDRNGQIWHTSSKYDPVQLDWTRYTLGMVMLLVGTSSLAFLFSGSTPRETKQAESGPRE